MKIKKSQNRIGVLLAVLAFVAVLGISVKDSLAYFTTYARAQGGKVLTLGNSTELKEEYDGQKHIRVSNQGNADCYVRVKVFAGSLVELTYEGSSQWALGSDGYYYYGDIVPVGGMTDELLVSIHASGEIKELGTDFDVIVIQECAPVMYDENGNPYPASDAEVWAQSFEVNAEGGAGNE